MEVGFLGGDFAQWSVGGDGLLGRVVFWRAG